MGLTIIEQDTMHAIQNACRVISNKKIDWEERRYEIAKEVMASIAGHDARAEEVAKESVAFADALINELKK